MPHKSDSSKAGNVQTGNFKADSVQADSSQTGSSQTDSSQTDSSQIDIAAGSIQGYAHRRKGQNNQDAFAWKYLAMPIAAKEDIVNHSTSKHSASPMEREKPGAFAEENIGLIAVVCDGCGSCASSEVGAQLGSKWVLNAIAKRLQTHGSSTDDQAWGNQFWDEVKQDVLRQMRSLITSLQGSCSSKTRNDADWSIIQSYLLFTIMGAVMTPELTVIFGCGDGIFAINDDVRSIGPFVNNAPPYLAYGLMPEGYTPFSPEDLQFTIHRQVSTSEVRSLLIGSDGVEDLQAIATQSLPHKQEPIGDISQFWEGDRYFKNPDMVRRRLALINREQVTPDWEHQCLTKSGGLLPDDTTLVVVRRSVSTPSTS